MPVDGRRPFTEAGEVLQNELIREAATGEEPKFQGLINQVYLNDLPSFLPERYIKKEAFVKTIADYTTGTVTVGTGTTNIIGASTSWTSANSDDTWINVNGFNTLYRMTFEAGTSLTFQDSLTWTESSGSGQSYTLFQDRYSLASDFGYMVKDDPDDPNVVFVYQNGVKIFLNPLTNEAYDRLFTANIGSIYAYTVKRDSATNYLHIQNNPDNAENVGYTYIPVITQLRELTTGTASLSGASGTALVLTSTASMTLSLDTARTIYFRNDADGTGSKSRWAQITTVANGSTGTLSSAQAFNITSGTGLTYTISEISEWPARFDDAMIYKAAWIADPDGKQAEKWQALFSDAISFDLTVESKRKRGHQLKSFPGLRQ